MMTKMMTIFLTHNFREHPLPVVNSLQLSNQSYFICQHEELHTIILLI